MIRPDLAIRPTAPTAATTPLAAAGGGRGFGALYGDVRGEVEDFIANGSGPSMPAAPMLTLEGQRVRDAVTAAASPSFSGDQAAFVAGVTPAAEEAARQLGVAPELVVAHAALESGWGRKPLLQADGSTTHNVFGIKATGGWTGDVAAARTTEVEDGVAVPRTERFRSYPDATAAFRDYAQVLLDNPRYRGALNTGSDARAFAEGLARGGYATDPAYADKLTGVARSVMGQAMNGYKSAGCTVPSSTTRARITFPLPLLRTRTTAPRAPLSWASPATVTVMPSRCATIRTLSPRLTSTGADSQAARRTSPLRKARRLDCPTAVAGSEIASGSDVMSRRSVATSASESALPDGTAVAAMATLADTVAFSVNVCSQPSASGQRAARRSRLACRVSTGSMASGLRHGSSGVRGRCSTTSNCGSSQPSRSARVSSTSRAASSSCGSTPRGSAAATCNTTAPSAAPIENLNRR